MGGLFGSLSKDEIEAYGSDNETPSFASSRRASSLSQSNREKRIEDKVKNHPYIKKQIEKQPTLKEKQEKIKEYVDLLTQEQSLRDTIFHDAREHRTIPFKLLLGPTGANIIIKQASKLRKTSYGYTHACLQVGSMLLDWSDSSLVYPRPFKSKARVALDINLASEIKVTNSEELINKICDLVANWNRNYEYSATNRNCQHFVEAVLRETGVKPFWNEYVQNFLDKVRENPDKLIPQVTVRGPNGLPKTITWKTHEELDIYAKELLKENPKLYADLYPLLKAFDRGFWLNDELKNIPYDVAKCHFGAPSI